MSIPISRNIRYCGISNTVLGSSMVAISVANQNFFHGISKRAKPYATMVEEITVSTTFGITYLNVFIM